jgi:hypothetical protein
MRSHVATRKDHHFTIFQTVEDDSHLLDLLVIATSPEQKSFFINRLISSLPDAFSGQSGNHFQLFTIWFGQYGPESHTSFKHISTALKLRHKFSTENRFQKRHFIHAIGLDTTPAMNETFYSTVDIIYLSKLAKPYPPKYHWMVESKAIDDQWSYYMKHGKQPDKRLRRYPLFPVDLSKLQRDISPTDDLLIFDKKTKQLVMLVLRNFVGHTPLLTHMGDVIKRGIQYRKSMRVCFVTGLFTSSVFMELIC